LEEVRHVFESVERGTTAARRAHRGEIGVLRIGYVGSVAYSGLPEIVHAFRARLPGVEIRMQERSPARQVEALLGERLDVGFARGPVDEPALDVQTVLDEPLVAEFPSSTRLRRERRCRSARLLTSRSW
jgi:DNA-binding transcriptional LysR family regulator